MRADLPTIERRQALLAAYVGYEEALIPAHAALEEAFARADTMHHVAMSDGNPGALTEMIVAALDRYAEAEIIARKAYRKAKEAAYALKH